MNNLSNQLWTYCTIYGSVCVKSGSYEWRIRCNTDLDELVIGVIEDRDELMKVSDC